MDSPTSSDREEDEAWSDLRYDICTLISSVRGAGSSATFQSFQEVVNPGIHLEGIGQISLPLTQPDADRLIAKICKAPFGKGDQTLIDESVRKTWEIDAGEVDFLNPAWAGWFDSVVKTVERELGVVAGPGSIRAEPYKMLLYGEGAFFKPHKDTEKTPNMFGTLVICLPSQHTGGTLRVQSGLEDRYFDTAGTSAYGTSFIAWYADLRHEILPVTSGYRWVMTYNLIRVSSAFPASDAAARAYSDELSRLLRQWQHEFAGVNILCYALNHQYTDNSLELSSLKREDFFRAQHVANACDGGFIALLASMEKVVPLPVCDGWDGEAELNLQRICSLNGLALATSLGISEDNLLQESLFEYRDPNEQSGGEYMGNENAELNQYYYDSVLVIVPKPSVFDFLLKRNSRSYAFRNLLNLFRKSLAVPKHESLAREMILHACQSYLELEYPNPHSEAVFLGSVAVASLWINNIGLFKDTVDSVSTCFTEETFLELGEEIILGRSIVVDESLSTAFGKVGQLQKRLKSLRQFQNGLSSRSTARNEGSAEGHVADWVYGKIEEALTSCHGTTSKDAAAIIDILKQYNDGISDGNVKRFVSRSSTTVDFANGLMAEILSMPGSERDKLRINSLIPLVLDTAVNHFVLGNYVSEGKSTPQDYPYSSWPDCGDEHEKAQLDAGIVVQLYKESSKGPTGDEASATLLSRIQSQTCDIPQRQLEWIIVPILDQLISVVLPSGTEPSHAVQQFYQNTLMTYTARVLREKPQRPIDWSLPEADVKYAYESTEFKSELQAFLSSKDEQTHVFSGLRGPTYIEGKLQETCDTEIIDRKNLKVTKTLKDWEKRHQQWMERAFAVKATFEGLPQAELKQCLGERYGEILNLDAMRLDHHDPGHGHAEEEQADEQSHSVVPQKRGHDVAMSSKEA